MVANKYVSAGMFIRHCDEWVVHTNYTLNRKQCKKMASHNLKAYSILRHCYKNLIIPLSWIVDYRGETFEVQSISPISVNTLVYGSDTHGLNYVRKDLVAEDIAKVISEKLNLQPHKFTEKLTINETKKDHEIFLPHTVQIHRGPGKEENAKYYIVNPGWLFCCDTILTNDPDYVPNLVTRQLRPEWIINNNNDELADGYIKITWKTPTKCCAWGHYIQSFEYYFYEKRNLDKKRTILAQLYCCPPWYLEVQSEINTGISPDDMYLGNKYPWHKFVKRELPHSKRGEYWLKENEVSSNIKHPNIG